MSTHLPGNPYTDGLTASTLDGQAVAKATLALAYEQRTANLIAVLPITESFENARVRDQITTRLGLDAEQA